MGNRIPSLDGLRAVSIGLVVIAHLSGTRGFPLPAAGTALTVSHVGVQTFFVISGFLITGLLLHELGRDGRIRLGRFYFRRTLRIFPPYYAFLAALVIAEAIGILILSPGDVAHAVTYTSNYDASRSWWIGHTWSLGVEEQFYLLWPATLVLLGMRRGLVVAASIVVLTPLIRLAELQFFPAYVDGIGARFETIADAIAIGCVLACTRTFLHTTPLYMRLLRSPLMAAAPVLVFAGSMLGDHPRIAYVIGQPIATLAMALVLDWAVTFPAGRIGRVLNAAPLAFIGLISYSLYLWQQPFLNRSSSLWWSAFPANIILAVACAVASYYVIERPSLVLRARLEKRGKPLCAPDPLPSSAAAS